jgi:hypothetical protein
MPKILAQGKTIEYVEERNRQALKEAGGRRQEAGGRRRKMERGIQTPTKL